MDPNVAYETALTGEDAEERAEAAVALLAWLAKGGATPTGHSRAEVVDQVEGILLDLIDEGSD